MKKLFKLFFALVICSIPNIVFASEYLVCGEGKKIPLALANILSIVVTIVKIFIPILLVIGGMISFFKATVSSKVDDELKKAKDKLINSFIAAVIIFFIVSIISAVVSFAVGKKTSVMSCVECLIKPDSCPHETSDGEVICPGLFSDQDKYDENCNLKEEYKNVSNTQSTNDSQNTDNSSAQNNVESNDTKTVSGIKYVDGILIVNKSYGLSKDYVPTNANGSDYCKECLTSQTMEAFNNMKADAMSIGLNLYIASGYRSYSYQSGLYQRYVNRDGKAAADTYSARPGHSEHQTGLAFDLNDVNDSFANTDEGKWVAANCYKYGLILRYPKGKESKTGYKYEPWHFRYVGVELASKLYNNGNWITLEEYFNLDSKYE